MLTPRQVETAAQVGDLRRIERRLGAEELAEYLVTTAQMHKPSFLGEEAPERVDKTRAVATSS
jgi:thiamine biosynthesis protein ThiI